VAKLSQIIRNRAEIVVEIDGTDDDGKPIKVPVTVTYRPRLMTLAFREQFGRLLEVLNRAQREAEAAAERNESATAALNAPEVERAAEQISEMALSLLESWDVEDEDEDGKPVPLPLPKTAEEMQTFVAPELIRAVMEAVMTALNPNRSAGEPNETASPAT
jgi:hypothetical protein